MSKKGQYKIPFNDTNNLMHYPEAWCGKTIRWEENFEFDDTLVYDGYARGRSAAYLWFKSKLTSQRYCMFMSDFDEVVSRLSFGEISGRFTFCKKGQNYGIKIV